ncbi:FecR family protein [Flexithrix dorotheae]|uniref:FecR family protein n=1 Tax=Flexithrix dorotheae TaxID=70993 RepID=UPI00036B98FC|nr:FecR family protein [Flexithrix dorotheae]
MNKEKHVDQLIEHPQFQQWVKNPDSQSDKYWEEWMGDNPERVEAVDLAKKVLLSISFKEENMVEREVDVLWNKIKVGVQEPYPVHVKTSSNPLWWKYAAAITAILVCAFAYLVFIQNEKEENKTAVVYLEKTNQLGQKATIFLGDGTVIKLNSGSTLKYPKVFNNDERVVYLEGEAFFEVAKNPKKPFTVISGKIRTKVLGTSFNVRAYPEDNKVQVAVLSGKVGVKVPSKESLVLLPNESAIYNKSESEVKHAKVDMEKELAWKDNIIYFKNADFEEIRNVLERWYGVNFLLKKDVKIEYDFTGKFENRSLESVLEGISFSLDFQFEIDKDTVVIF